MQHPFIPNKDGTVPKRLIVFLHGLGSNGEDLISLVSYIQPALPDTYFFSPNGIEAYDMAPYGRQWFSLKDRDPQVIYNQISNAAPTIATLIKSKINELGLTPQDTIICGFSQGAMTALYVAIAGEENYGGVIGFSGALILPQYQHKPITTPICLIHGEQDEIVTHDNLLSAVRRLTKLGVPIVEHLSIPNLAHTIDLQGISFAVNFIKKHC